MPDEPRRRTTNTRRPLWDRRILCGALFAGAVCATTTTSRPARPDLWGGDLPLLAGILAEAVSKVANLGSMLTQIVTQVNLMRTMLSGVDPGSFTALTTFLRTASRTEGALTGGIDSLTYTLRQIDGQFTASPRSRPLTTCKGFSSARPATTENW